jgi:hypothetical protein
MWRLSLSAAHFCAKDMDKKDMDNTSTVIDFVQDGKRLDNRESLAGVTRLTDEFGLILKK